MYIPGWCIKPALHVQSDTDVLPASDVLRVGHAVHALCIQINFQVIHRQRFTMGLLNNKQVPTSFGTLSCLRSHTSQTMKHSVFSLKLKILI